MRHSMRHRTATLAWIVAFLILGIAVFNLTKAGEPGPDDAGGIPLRGPDDVTIEPLAPMPVSKSEIVPRAIGSFEFVHNCTDERLPNYDPYGPACDDRDVPITETEITIEPPAPPPPPATAPPMPMPMMPCNRAHCDD